MSEPVLEGTAYLVVERDGMWRLRIAEMRKNKPAMRSGQMAVKVKLVIPRKAFDEFIPEVIATIGAGDLIAPTIEVIPPPEEEHEPDGSV